MDYKIDLRTVPEKDQASIIDGVQTVIENASIVLVWLNRTFTHSTVADEAHIIVELAEIGTIDQIDVETYLEKDKSWKT